MHEVKQELGDNVSDTLYQASKQTYNNRPGLITELHESFSGFRAVDGAYFGDISSHVFSIGLDGVGTKVEVAERIQDHSTVAYDLFAMICDDAVVRGGEPLLVGSVLDVNQLGDSESAQTTLRQLADGYIKAAKAANVVVANGETAELGYRINGYPPDAIFHFQGKDEVPLNYNWAGVVQWFAHKDRVLSGHQIKPGDSLVGLTESGFRSNGYTSVRRVMEAAYGEWWHMAVEKELGSTSLGELICTQSTIYSSFINELTGGYDIEKEPKAEVSGIAHITGGGQPEKIGRMLEPMGYGAVIDDPIEPPKIMKHVQELGIKHFGSQYSDYKAHGKWHMGPGMIIATPDPESVLSASQEHEDIQAKRIGEVTEQSRVQIRNLGVEQKQKYLNF